MPYTTSVAGTTITASWANANVRDQTVTPFASTSAMTSAITSPVVGMLESITSNDSGEGLIFRNSAGQWRKPWNMPWGYIAGVSNLTNTNSGVNNSYADLSLSATFTAIANRYYYIACQLPYCSNASGSAITAGFEFADAANTRISLFAYNAIAASTGITVTGSWTTVLAAGSQTIKVRGSSASATAWVLGGATAPAQLTIFDMGPAGAPS